MNLTQKVLVLTIGSVLVSCGSGKKSGNNNPDNPVDSPAGNPPDPGAGGQAGLVCNEGKVELKGACVPPVELITTSAAGETNIIDKGFFVYKVVEGASAAVYYAPRNTRLATLNGMPLVGYVHQGQTAILNATFSLVPSSLSANYRELKDYAAAQGLVLKRALIDADAVLLMDEENFKPGETNVKLSGESSDARDAVISVFLTEPGSGIVEKSTANYEYAPADFMTLRTKLRMGDYTADADIALRLGCVKIDADNTVTSRKTDSCAGYWTF